MNDADKKRLLTDFAKRFPSAPKSQIQKTLATLLKANLVGLRSSDGKAVLLSDETGTKH